MPIRGDLFSVKSGLYHIGVCAVGDIVMRFILLAFRQAVRVVAIAMSLFSKQLWCLIVSPKKGRSVLVMFWHSICSISSHRRW